MSKGITRRQFWQIPPLEAVRSVLTGRPLEAETIESPLRPPGADLDDSSFLAACEKCHKCLDACPFEAIELLGPEWGELEGTPSLLPQSNPCRWCPEYDCVKACPSGALSLGASGKPSPIGHAIVDPAACLTTQGILCDECVYRCPPSIGAISLKQRMPQINLDLCTGCGLCAYYCAADTSAIRIVKS